MRFAEIPEGDIRLTDPGKRFAKADVDERKMLFARHCSATFRWQDTSSASWTSASRTMTASRFRDELEDHMSEQAATDTLRAVISWARYGEAFAYDDHSGSFSLDNPS